jgi:hypothetical protein
MLNQPGISSQTNQAITPPELADLNKLLSQALGRPGLHVKALWFSPDKSSEYVLDVISNTNGGDPKWQLYRTQFGTRALLFDYPSCDVLLVHNAIGSACSDTTATKAKRPMIVPDTPPPFMNHAAPEGVTASADIPTTGDIAKVPLDNLLHGLKAAKMTGKLEVSAGPRTALLFVKDGMPVDATADDTEGDEALVELLTWTSGKFVFEPRVLRNSHTVHQPIESLVAQSKQLAERNEYLAKAGMRPTSSLTHKDASLADSDFVQKIGHGAPGGIEELTKFYWSLNGKLTINEMLHSGAYPRIQLTNMIYHLLINGLIKITNPIVLEKKSPVHARAIEHEAIQSVMMVLRRMETGMFIYPAFLYFLEQEYFRCYRSKTPLSVIVFEMRMQAGDSVREVLPSAAVLDAVLRISQLKRHVDLLAHYDSFDYALLLPNTKANGAQIFAKRIVKSLTDSPLAGEIDSDKLSLALGCASMPEDFSDLGELLGGADMAMAHSRENKKSVIMYRDIKPITL